MKTLEKKLEKALSLQGENMRLTQELAAAKQRVIYLETELREVRATLARGSY